MTSLNFASIWYVLLRLVKKRWDHLLTSNPYQPTSNLLPAPIYLLAICTISIVISRF